jgi:hypothetical protein
MVVGQESQILPAFILKFDDESCKRHYEGWHREVCSYLDYTPVLSARSQRNRRLLRTIQAKSQSQRHSFLWIPLHVHVLYALIVTLVVVAC